MRFIMFFALLYLGVFTGTALAADAVAASDPSFSELAKSILDAVTHSNWYAAAAYGVIIGMIGARKFMPASWKEGIKGDIVGTATVFAMAFAGAIATWAVGLGAGASMTVAVALTAVKVATAAIGGYTVIHKVVGWLTAWGKLPAWMVPVLKMLAALVGSNAIKKAEAAGNAAVVADPPKGMAGDSKIVEVE